MPKKTLRNGYGHMVHDYLLARVKEKCADRKKVLDSLCSREDALKYREKVRAAIKSAFEPFPGRTGLNAEITREIRRSGYKVQNVKFASRPGVLVSANLYLPAGGAKKRPGVLVPCGHYIHGKAAPRYQELCQRLAQSGCAAMVYDPFNQGERNQYFKLRGREAKKLSSTCTYAHNMMGKQLELFGEFFGSWRAWDGVRSLDYLASRPDIDGSRLGVTGNSGGGTLTAWLWALDDRFTMAAPSCFITTFLRNLENELPADCEQCPPGVIGLGLEMADFLIAAAPKPVLILGQKYDYFDSSGLEESFREVKRFYGLLGAGDKVARFIGENPHGYYPDAREKMLSFFCRHAGLKKTASRKLTVSRPESLFCFPGGEAVKAGSIPVYDLIRGKTAARLPAGTRPVGRNLPGKIRDVLRIPARAEKPHYRVLRPADINGLRAARFAVETETGIRAVAKKIPVEKVECFVLEAEKESRVYLPHISSEADISRGEPPFHARGEFPFYAVDVRGIGESMPDEAGSFFNPYGMDYMLHAYHLMLGESYLGKRVYDCVSFLDLLCSRGAEKITLCGRGQGAVIAVLAAALHEPVKNLILKNSPASFASWAENFACLWPASNFPRGVLNHFDIPDCLKASGAGVEIISPWDHSMRAAD